jgi:hypothetical protein
MIFFYCIVSILNLVGHTPWMLAAVSIAPSIFKSWALATALFILINSKVYVVPSFRCFSSCLSLLESLNIAYWILKGSCYLLRVINIAMLGIDYGEQGPD